MEAALPASEKDPPPAALGVVSKKVPFDCAALAVRGRQGTSRRLLAYSLRFQVSCKMPKWLKMAVAAGIGGVVATLLGGLSQNVAAAPSLPPPMRATLDSAAFPPLRTAATPAPSPAMPGVRRVLIVSEDGMHPALIRGQSMPWHEWLTKSGSYTFQAHTISTACTLPSHASMLSGVDVHEHGLIWNNWRPERGFIHVPTIFSQAENSGLHTAAFVGKFKLRHILPAGTIDTFVRPGYYCKKVSDEAAIFLEKERPELTFVHFSDPDDAGHSEGWLSTAQMTAAREADQCLGTLIRALERAGTLDETLIIVLADHGGHGRGHGKITMSEIQIPVDRPRALGSPRLRYQRQGFDNGHCRDGALRARAASAERHERSAGDGDL